VRRAKDRWSEEGMTLQRCAGETRKIETLRDNSSEIRSM